MRMLVGLMITLDIPDAYEFTQSHGNQFIHKWMFISTSTVYVILPCALH